MTPIKLTTEAKMLLQKLYKNQGSTKYKVNLFLFFF